MLKNLPYMLGVKSRMISAENPTGEKGKGCMEVPNPLNKNLHWSKFSLGKGWKVRPFIRINAKELVTIAEMDGPAIIKSIFLTSDKDSFSDLIIRIYWDFEDCPSVESPVGAFFCMGHAGYSHEVYSMPIVVAPYRGLNSYFEMPFKKHCKITIENIGDTSTEILAYKVLYHEQEFSFIDQEVGYFHAQYNESTTSVENAVYTILDHVQGKGVYIGTYIAWTNLNNNWWGEGEVKFYLDDDREYPTIADNGTEDYFGGAWNFGGYGICKNSDEKIFNSSFIGLPFVKKINEDKKLISMYRFHIPDPIGFKKNIKVTVQTLGWEDDFSKYRKISEHLASVAYWYQIKK